MEISSKYTNKISTFLIEINQILLMNILNDLNDMAIKNKLDKFNDNFSNIVQNHNNNSKTILNSLTLEQLKDIRIELDNIILLKEHDINNLFEKVNPDWAIIQ